jgi:uncharacterized protein YcnI
MRTTRVLGTLAGSAVIALALGGTAAAHVTVQAPGATQGGFTKMTFRMPTERDVPSTKLEVAFPADQPIASVSVKPQPGWSYVVTKGAPPAPFEAFGETVTEVVQRITWTATGPGVKPGEFAEFEVSAGPLPTVASLTFRALQTYAGGEVVRWIEDRTPGGEEPEHPAPVLQLAPAAATSSASATASASASAPPSAAGTGDDDEDEDEDMLQYAGIGLGGLALIVAIYAAIRSGRRPTADV